MQVKQFYKIRESSIVNREWLANPEINLRLCAA